MAEAREKNGAFERGGVDSAADASITDVGNFAGSKLLCGAPLEVWFSDQHAEWVAGNEAMVGRVTCGTRAARQPREGAACQGYRATPNPSTRS